MLAEPPEISCCFASLKVNVKYRNFCKIKNILVRSLENLLLLNLALYHPGGLVKFGAPPPFIAREKGHFVPKSKDILSPKGIQCHVTSRDREVIGNAKLKASAMRERQRQGIRGTCRVKVL